MATNGPGRPTLLTRKLEKEIMQNVELGLAYAEVCRLVGISYSTFLEWQRKGREEEARAPYRGFVERLDSAKIRGKRNNILGVRLAGRDDWKALAFLLERQWPEEYGRRQIVDARHSTPDGALRYEHSQVLDLSGVEDDDLEKVIGVLRKVVHAESPALESGDGG
jgi:transposase